jgi:phosphocarrier protein
MTAGTPNPRAARPAAGGRHVVKKMLERDLQITHPLGLHAQASAKVVQALTGFRSQAFLMAKGREVNAKSIMGVMLLAAGPGTSVRARIEGEDEAAAMAALVALFDSGF